MPINQSVSTETQAVTATINAHQAIIYNIDLLNIESINSNQEHYNLYCVAMGSYLK